MVMQRKTHRPVQFEITEPTQQSIAAWIENLPLARQCELAGVSRASIYRRQTQQDSTDVPNSCCFSA
jgi:hypothetical protein